jgi:hypothetical protein
MSLLQVNSIQSASTDTIVVKSNLLFESGKMVGYGASDIGIQGGYGFGVAPYPFAVPQDFSAMSGTYDVLNENWGNYVYVDGSIMVWIPRFYYRIGHSSSPRYPTFGANAIDIAGDFTFPSEAAANAAGYALHRAFMDGGVEKPGFFVDKFEWSNNAGRASSIKNGNPLSSHADHNPWGSLTNAATPANNYGGAFAASKTRGGVYANEFFPIFRHHWAALAMLAQAHAQAVTSTTTCAWYDASNTINFPKGNSNNLRDVNDPGVLYTSTGHATYSSCGKTGSGTPFAKTTHNGQNCGVADLNGNMWEVTPGITSNGTLLYLLKEAVACKNLTADTAFTYDADRFYTHSYGTDTGALAGTGQSVRFGNASNGVFASSTDRTTPAWRLTGMGIPQPNGAATSGSNHFGQDGIWDYKPANMCPFSGGGWSRGTDAGDWTLDLANERSHSHFSVGGRSALYP